MKKEDMIIFVGSDGAGKTTASSELSKVLGYPVEHHGPVKSHQQGYEEYFNSVLNTNYSVIKDRFFEGEKIFAPLYRGYEANYFPELEQAIMQKFNPLLVLVYAPFDVILKRIDERGEDFVRPEHFQYCYDKVLGFFNDSSLPKMMIDTEHLTVEQNCLEILKRVYR